MLGLVIIAIKYGSLWFEGYNCGAQIGLFELVMMGLRQVNQKSIMKAKIKAVQANLRTEKDKTPGVEIDGTFVTTQRLEAHYLAGGDVTKIIEALVASKNAGIALEFDQAAAIDLAGRDVVEAVRTSVDPKVISCPDPQRSGKEFLSAVAKDGVELKVHAQVTVRTNLEQLIGGATEETIIARVGESIISAIGSATLHSDVLQNPGMITKAVLERGLDSQTAFEIVSIDIANAPLSVKILARVFKSIRLKRILVWREPKEQRRAEAIAVEQEQKAEVVGNQATLIQAEAEVPKAMAAAFRTGNIDTKG